MTIFCKHSDIENESDVEQKLIIPIMTADYPNGLGYSVSDFRSKPDIRRFEIDKGKSAKLYFPDYIIVIQGLPFIIIEAKGPNENIEEAFREARLYASEINAQFKSNINPCSKIIVTNGNLLWGGNWDSIATEIELQFIDIDATNPKYSKFLGLFSKSVISLKCQKIYKEIRKDRNFSKPLRIIGGKYVQNEELEQNSFGATIALEYRHLFNPETLEERRVIVQNAYVTTNQQLKHCQPIDRLIRAAKPPSITDAKQIRDTGQPEEIVSKLHNPTRLKHALFLLVGSVGSGKTTFIDYLKEVSLPQDIKETSVWANIDLNTAPLSREEIYDWLKKQLISQLYAAYSDIDFEDYNTLLKLYSVEIRQLEKGPASLFAKDSLDYKRLLANKLLSLQQDIDKTLQCLIRYLCAERAKLLIVVLDNCDKRKRDDQFLMFDVAKWLQKELECLVFLPIRDTTYDHHRKEPPLDTAVKDLVFRIDPPLLMDVIARRIKYAMKTMQTDESEILSYSLPNGIVVEYPQSDQATYLSCILRSLFEDIFFRRLISGIAGRDIRKGIEIFLDFCKSAYINTDEMYKIRRAKGKYTLPPYIITRVLIRGSRKYYRDESSFIKNLFTSYPEDTMPDPFLRIAILRWLEIRCRKPGPNNIIGYHKISELLLHLSCDCHSEDRIRTELIKLLQAGCIITEAQVTDNIDDEDLISITPTGHVHLDLLNNFSYLSSCAEDVWYLDQTIANQIANRMTGKIGKGHLELDTTLANAEDLLNYLSVYKTTLPSNPEAYLGQGFENLTDLSESLRCIETKLQNIREVESLRKQYPRGTLIEGQVYANTQEGLVVEFDFHKGIVHKDDKSYYFIRGCERGEWLTLNIKYIDTKGQFFLTGEN